MTLINFALLIFFTKSKSSNPGFSESVKVIGGNSVKQNVSEGENWH